MKKTIVALVALSIAIAFTACKKDDESQADSNTITDSRDGNKYLTVDLYGKTWFKENLRYEVPTSTTDSTWCYDNDCSQGRLYNHAAALKACPSGWRLPTHSEHHALRDSLAGGSGPVLNTVVFEGGSSGLEYKKTGFRDVDGSFKAKGFGSYLWSSTSDGLSTTNDFMAFVSDTSAPYILTTGRDAAKGLCVRCLKD